MGGTFRGFTLRDDDLFTAQLAQIAAIRHIDEALNGITWVLCNEPESCPVVPGTTRLRLIRTDPYRRGLVDIPPLRVWFSIEGDGIVLRRAIEVIPDWDTPDESQQSLLLF